MPGKKRPPIPDDPATPVILTHQQRAFVKFYTSGNTMFNAMASAAKARYSVKSRSRGHQLLNDPYIAREINRELAKVYADSESVLARVIQQAMASGLQYLTVNGRGETKFDGMKALATGAIDLVEEIEFNTDKSVKKVKMSDRKASQELLLKVWGRLKEAAPPPGSVKITLNLGQLGGSPPQQLVDIDAREMKELPAPPPLSTEPIPIIVFDGHKVEPVVPPPPAPREAPTPESLAAKLKVVLKAVKDRDII